MTVWLGLVLASGIAGAGLSPAVSGRDGHSQKDWLVRVWQNDEGLIENNILGVAQTPDGYLWVAVGSGLTRFDGADFDHFFTQHLPEAKNRVVRSLHLDRRGRLWVSLSRGLLLCVEDATLEVFTEGQGLPRAQVSCMAEDAAGTMWFTTGRQLFRIRGSTVEAVREVEGLSSEGRWQLASDPQGSLWCARGTQLGFFRTGVWQPYSSFQSAVRCLALAREGGVWAATESQIFRCREGQEPEASGPLPDAYPVSVLLEDRKGALWVGGTGLGLKRLMAGRLESVPVLHSDVSCLTEDREGNLWVGTQGGGLNLVRSRGLDMVPVDAGLLSQAVRSVCQDRQGDLWAALQNGKLLHGRGSEWAAVHAGNGWLGGEATSVAGGQRGVWVGTRDRGLQQWRPDTMPQWTQVVELGNEWVRSLLETSNGDLLIATGSPNRLWLWRGGKLRALALPGEVRVIRALAEAVDGTVWVGTSDGQLLRIAGDHVIREPVPVGESAPSIRTLHATADGSLWIGYAGAGIGRLSAGGYLRLSTVNGLLDNFISQILSDGSGGLWMCCNRGLFQVRLQEMIAVTEGRANRVRSIVYGRNEGLPSLQPAFDSSPRACRTSAGELWFATRNGLLRVQPDRIPDNPIPPPVVLQSVMVDDHVVGRDDSHFPLRPSAPMSWVNLRARNPLLQLPADHQKLEFEFAALSYSSAENVHFRYRLAGFDREWIDAGTQRRAIYPRLSPGQYRFEVMACNNAGVWNTTGRPLPFTVLPSFWQTWWFRSLTIAVFTCGVVGVVRYVSFQRLRAEVRRLERQTELQRERARIARDMHDEVGAKLSRLSLLSEMAAQHPAVTPEARGEIAEISESAREAIRSFEEIVWAVTPTNDTLPNLVNYLCRFAEEFFEGSESQCVFDLPEVMSQAELSTEVRHHLFLAAKEALNNTLKHAQARRVEVRLRVLPRELELGIRDDGVGFDPPAVSARAGGHNGLGNMRERMRLARGEIEVLSKPGEGTTVRLRVPLKPEGRE